MKNTKTTNPIPESYNGKFYIGINTYDAFSDIQIVSDLNDLCDQIINEIGSNITTWVFTSHLNAFKAVGELQNKECSFTLVGENGLLFIDYNY